MPVGVAGAPVESDGGSCQPFFGEVETLRHYLTRAQSLTDLFDPADTVPRPNPDRYQSMVDYLTAAHRNVGVQPGKRKELFVYRDAGGAVMGAAVVRPWYNEWQVEDGWQIEHLSGLSEGYAARALDCVLDDAAWSRRLPLRANEVRADGGSPGTARWWEEQRARLNAKRAAFAAYDKRRPSDPDPGQSVFGRSVTDLHSHYWGILSGEELLEVYGLDDPAKACKVARNIHLKHAFDLRTKVPGKAKWGVLREFVIRYPQVGAAPAETKCDTDEGFAASMRQLLLQGLNARNGTTFGETYGIRSSVVRKEASADEAVLRRTIEKLCAEGVAYAEISMTPAPLAAPDGLFSAGGIDQALADWRPAGCVLEMRFLAQTSTRAFAPGGKNLTSIVADKFPHTLAFRGTAEGEGKAWRLSVGDVEVAVPIAHATSPGDQARLVAQALVAPEHDLAGKYGGLDVVWSATVDDDGQPVGYVDFDLGRAYVARLVNASGADSPAGAGSAGATLAVEETSRVWSIAAQQATDAPSLWTLRLRRPLAQFAAAGEQPPNVAAVHEAIAVPLDAGLGPDRQAEAIAGTLAAHLGAGAEVTREGATVRVAFDQPRAALALEANGADPVLEALEPLGEPTAELVGLRRSLETNKYVVGVDILGPENARWDVTRLEQWKALVDMLTEVSLQRKRPLLLRPHAGEGSAPAMSDTIAHKQPPAWYLPKGHDLDSAGDPGTNSLWKVYPGINYNVHAPQRSGGVEPVHYDIARNNLGVFLNHVADNFSMPLPIARWDTPVVSGHQLRPGSLFVRIGHGTHLNEQQARLARTLGIAVDVNLTSNWITGARQPRVEPAELPPPAGIASLAPLSSLSGEAQVFDDHGVLAALDAGTLVTLGSDGQGVENSTLDLNAPNNEHQRLSELIDACFAERLEVGGQSCAQRFSGNRSRLRMTSVWSSAYLYLEAVCTAEKMGGAPDEGLCKGRGFSPTPSPLRSAAPRRHARRRAAAAPRKRGVTLGRNQTARCPLCRWLSRIEPRRFSSDRRSLRHQNFELVPFRVR